MTLEATARKAQAAMEPLVAMIYFIPEGPAHYEQIGLKPRQAYFITRSAAMGAAPGEAVAATFYNFNPGLVVPLVNEGWQITTPQQATEARNQAAIEGLTRLLAEEDGTLPDVSRAVTLVKKACEGLRPEGRTLFAAHQGQAWPDENPLLSLWWGANLLREYRGDGHIAALMAAEISGIEAILITAAWSTRLPKPILMKTRAWSDEEYAATYQRLEERGLMKNEELTEEGRALREAVESTTDRLAVAPWRNLGDEAEEFVSLVMPLTKRILERGGLGAPRR